MSSPTRQTTFRGPLEKVLRRAVILCAFLAHGAPPTASAQSTTVDCEDWGGVLSGNVVLSNANDGSKCVFHKRIVITPTTTDSVATSPKRTLDCNGGSIEVDAYAAISMQAVVDPPDPAECLTHSAYADNVVIRNCTIRNIGSASNTGLGINIRRELFRSRVNGVCRAEADPYQYLSDHGYSPADAKQILRDLSPKFVTIENVTFVATKRTSVNVTGWSSGYVLHGLHVEGGSAYGVYLEPGSIGTRIEQSTFVGAPGSLGAVAIDGSVENVIEGSIFRNYTDPRGTISLFRNCGEGGTSRHEDADRNAILDSQFYDNQLGILIAPRQGLPKSSYGGPRGCLVSGSSESVVLTSAQASARWTNDICTRFLRSASFNEPADQGRFFFDYAKDNLVEGNVFVGTRAAAIVVQDDDNTIRGNRFLGQTRQDVCVGSPFLEIVGQPITGVVLEDNATVSTAGLPAFGSSNLSTVTWNNNADGSADATMLLTQ